MSGLIVLLPHGYEGQGPEHSSGRIERFLQLCAGNNMQVIIPTTPTQYFHLIRRQSLRKVRKPLIVFTPKSLLRLPEATSPKTEFMESTFQEVIEDTNIADSGTVETAILCTGKIYYDLIKARSENKTNIPVIRVEQLYPFPDKAINKSLSHFPALKTVRWVQEEPKNMGAWLFMEDKLRRVLSSKIKIERISRMTSASPAAGMIKVHNAEQNQIVQAAFLIP